MLLRFIGLMNLMLIHFVRSIFKGEELHVGAFDNKTKRKTQTPKETKTKENVHVGVRSKMYGPISFKLCMFTDTTDLYSLRSV